MNMAAEISPCTAAELRGALERDQIVPYFQPIVCLRTGRLAGFEVLARWPHPVRMMIPPAEFIPVAEESGLIFELTERIMLQACTEAADWPEELTLSVNIQPMQLEDFALPARLAAIAGRAGYPLSRIVLELTESAVVRNSEATREIIAELKTLGVQIALDDFGTGYSSLRQLQSLPFDKLKVDASFVREMTHRRESRKIVAAVVGLGVSLSLMTVAEGIETRQQADMLAALGCDLGQGWHFGRPVPGPEATRGVAEGRWNRPALEPLAGVVSRMALRMEASPSRRLAELQAIYDGAPVGLALVDTELRHLSLNQRLAAMNGWNVQETIGRKLTDMHPELFRVIGPHLQRALRGEAVTDVRVRWTPADRPGEERLYAASYYPVRDETDEVVGVSVAVLDITERTPMPSALPPERADGAEMTLVVGQVTIDLTRRLAVREDGTRVELTGAEYALLEALAAARGRPVSRDALSTAALRRPWRAEDRSVDQLVFGLRRKCGAHPNGHHDIQTVRGSGYILSKAAARTARLEASSRPASQNGAADPDVRSAIGRAVG